MKLELLINVDPGYDIDFILYRVDPSVHTSFCFSFVWFHVLFHATLNNNGDGRITSTSVGFYKARTL